MTLNDLKVGDIGNVTFIDETSNLYQRFIDIGIIKGTKIECVLKSPFGNPKAYLIRGAIIAIRDSDAKRIGITKEVREC
ncbi:MAG: ferrous iron transport protein A [Clostridia bacterium]|nr:ferrous iron transport protein A [Clostridia bacterium]